MPTQAGASTMRQAALSLAAFATPAPLRRLHLFEPGVVHAREHARTPHLPRPGPASPSLRRGECAEPPAKHCDFTPVCAQLASRLRSRCAWSTCGSVRSVASATPCPWPARSMAPLLAMGPSHRFPVVLASLASRQQQPHASSTLAQNSSSAAMGSAASPCRRPPAQSLSGAGTCDSPRARLSTWLVSRSRPPGRGPARTGGAFCSAGHVLRCSHSGQMQRRGKALCYKRAACAAHLAQRRPWRWGPRRFGPQ